jgi:diacylglycerol kinase (ATP)
MSSCAPVRDSGPARLIVNPGAGGGRAAEQHEQIAAQLAARWPDVEIACDQEVGVEETARDAASRGATTLLVIGGDGTFNAALNGVARVPGALARTTFGLIPGGTGNDLARTLGLGTRLEDAASLLLEASPRQIDLGMLDDRIFANVSAGGLFAEASEATTSEAKSVAGRLAYVIAGSRALIDHQNVVLELYAVTPEGPITWEGSVAMFAVCNAATAGGGQPLAPFARIDDGWLDAFVVQTGSALGIASVLLQIPGGTHLDDDRVVAFRASELTFRFARPTHVNADGEVALRERARYRVLPGATRILVPAGVVLAPDGEAPRESAA